MTSSTSSSEAHALLGWRTALATFLVIVVVSLVLARVVLHWAERGDIVYTFGAKRIQRASRLLESGKVCGDNEIFFLGSSKTEFGIVPRLADPVFARVYDRPCVVNFGFREATFVTLSLFARRVEDYVRDVRKGNLPLIVLEIEPGHLTRRRRQYSVSTRENQTINANLATWREALSPGLLSDDTSVWTALFAKLMGSTASGGTLESMIRDRLYGRPRAYFKHREKISDLDTDTILYGDPHGFASEEERVWSSGSRGFFDIGTGLEKEKLRKLVDFMSSDEMLSWNARFRQHCCDAIELNSFDPELTDLTVRTVKRLQAVADRVVVVTYPNQPVYGGRAPAARERMDAFIADLEARLGMKILRLDRMPDFVPADFLDIAHVNPDFGAPKLTHLASEAVISTIQSYPPPRRR